MESIINRFNYCPRLKYIGPPYKFSKLKIQWTTKEKTEGMLLFNVVYTNIILTYNYNYNYNIIEIPDKCRVIGIRLSANINTDIDRCIQIQSFCNTNKYFSKFKSEFNSLDDFEYYKQQYKKLASIVNVNKLHEAGVSICAYGSEYMFNYDGSISGFHCIINEIVLYMNKHHPDCLIKNEIYEISKIPVGKLTKVADK